jgi:hypothetical protein
MDCSFNTLRRKLIFVVDAGVMKFTLKHPYSFTKGNTQTFFVLLQEAF